MAATLVQDIEDGKLFNFAGSLTAIMPLLEGYLRGQGYRLIAQGDGEWKIEKGSILMRVFFGGFSPRFEFQITAREIPEGAQIEFHKGDTSIIFGGVVGISRMRREYKELTDGIARL